MITFEDADRRIKEYFESRPYVVEDEGNRIRAKIIMGDDPEYGQLQTPSIYIDSGYMIRTPLSWNLCQNTLETTKIGEKDFLDICSKETNVFYSYNISGTFSKKRHAINFQQYLLSLFPNKFFIDIFDLENVKHTVSGYRDDEVIPLDNYINNVLIHRRNIILTLQFKVGEISQSVWEMPNIKIKLTGGSYYEI